MRNISFKKITVSVLVLFSLSFLTACTEKELTPKDISLNLSKSGSWRTTATWDFMTTASKTRFNGIAWFDQKGKNYIYQDHGFGNNTFMRVLDGKVDAPGDPSPIVGELIDSVEGKKRIDSDLFSFDPLARAELAGIKLKPRGDFELYGIVKCIKEPLADAECVDVDLTVKFNDKGYPLEVTYNATRKDKSTTQIIFGYQDFGKINIKTVSGNMNFDKLEPPVYTLPPGTK